MKILVVDDEGPIRNYITHLISECEGPYEIVGSVNSGKKALELLGKQNVDLVFADITMPKMTGLELLERIKKQYPNTAVFMLTCHNDFEFAREAVKLQADNYILKDEINPTTLENLLRQVCEKREKAMKQALYRFESDAYFIQLMEEEETILFDSYDLEKHKIFLKDREFVACAMNYSRDNLERMVTFHSELMENREIFPYQETNIILLANLASKTGKNLYEQLPEMIGALRSYISGPVGVSRTYYKVNMLKKAVLEALEDYNLSYYQKRKIINDGQSEKREYQTEFQNSVNQARNFVIEKRYREALRLVEKAVEYAAEHSLDVYFMKKGIFDILNDYQSTSGRIVEPHRVFVSRNVKEVKEYLKDLSGMEGGEREVFSEMITDAVCYMKSHYGENLTLTELAERAHLNSDYFSRRFKKETGIKYSEYLLQIRMENARQLLLKTDLSITDIAAKTGFNNDGYFSTTVKKYYGKNPNEMRKSRKHK